jgi:NADPH2:quinone reductase
MHEFGPSEVLVGPGEVAIDVELANITFVETPVRAGRAPNPAMAPALPAIPGNGVGAESARRAMGATRRCSARG